MSGVNPTETLMHEWEPIRANTASAVENPRPPHYCTRCGAISAAGPTLGTCPGEGKGFEGFALVPRETVERSERWLTYSQHRYRAFWTATDEKHLGNLRVALGVADEEQEA